MKRTTRALLAGSCVPAWVGSLSVPERPGDAFGRCVMQRGGLTREAGFEAHDPGGGGCAPARVDGYRCGKAAVGVGFGHGGDAKTAYGDGCGVVHSFIV